MVTVNTKHCAIKTHRDTMDVVYQAKAIAALPTMWIRNSYNVSFHYLEPALEQPLWWCACTELQLPSTWNNIIFSDFQSLVNVSHFAHRCDVWTLRQTILPMVFSSSTTHCYICAQWKTPKQNVRRIFKAIYFSNAKNERFKEKETIHNMNHNRCQIRHKNGCTVERGRERATERAKAIQVKCEFLIWVRWKIRRNNRPDADSSAR